MNLKTHTAYSEIQIYVNGDDTGWAARIYQPDEQDPDRGQFDTRTPDIAVVDIHGTVEGLNAGSIAQAKLDAKSVIDPLRDSYLRGGE